METILHKNLSQKISQLPKSMAQKVSDYIDSLLEENSDKIDSEMTSDEFQNWIATAEQGENMTLDEFKAKWKEKENDLLNRTN